MRIKMRCLSRIRAAVVMACWLLGVACGNASDGSAQPKATPCAKDADCPAQEQCDLARGECESGAGGAGPGNSAVTNQNVSAHQQCTVSPQAGCPTGSVCRVANAAGQTSCYGTGDGPYAAPCSSINDCQADYLCVYGQCRAQCKTVADCPSAPYASCQPYPMRDQAPAIPGASFCSVQCNPVDPTNVSKSPDFTGCLPNTACNAQDTDVKSGATSCYLSGDALTGGSCVNTSDCRPGLVCLLDQTLKAGKCAPFCLIGRGQCATGSCLQFGEHLHVAVGTSLLELGYCG